MKITPTYALKMLASLLGYSLGLIALNLWYQPLSPYRWFLVLLPVLPLLYMVKVIIDQLTQMDEMWRRIQTEAWAFAGLATGFSAFSYLFVRDMGGPEFQAEWAFYLMWFYYGIGSIWSVRKYR